MAHSEWSQALWPRQTFSGPFWALEPSSGDLTSPKNLPPSFISQIAFSFSFHQYYGGWHHLFHRWIQILWYYQGNFQSWNMDNFQSWNMVWLVKRGRNMKTRLSISQKMMEWLVYTLKEASKSHRVLCTSMEMPRSLYRGFSAQNTTVNLIVILAL